MQDRIIKIFFIHKAHLNNSLTKVLNYQQFNITDCKVNQSNEASSKSWETKTEETNKHNE